MREFDHLCERPKVRRLVNVIVLLEIVIFFVAGIAKMLALVGGSGAHLLAHPNPVFQFLPNSAVLTAAAALDLAVVVLAARMYRSRPIFALAVVA
jgi:hypothetical protein